MKWLVALDESLWASYALNYVITFANRDVDVVYLMHVVEKPEQFLSGTMDTTQAERVFNKSNKRGTRILVHYAKKCEKEGIEFVMMKGTADNVGEMIARTVKKYNIDIAVIGQHSKPDTAKFRLGTTSRLALERAKCTVVVVKRPFGEAEEHERIRAAIRETEIPRSGREREFKLRGEGRRREKGKRRSPSTSTSTSSPSTSLSTSPSTSVSESPTRYTTTHRRHGERGEAGWTVQTVEFVEGSVKRDKGLRFSEPSRVVEREIVERRPLEEDRPAFELREKMREDEKREKRRLKEKEKEKALEKEREREERDRERERERERKLQKQREREELRKAPVQVVDTRTRYRDTSSSSSSFEPHPRVRKDVHFRHKHPHGYISSSSSSSSSSESHRGVHKDVHFRHKHPHGERPHHKSSHHKKSITEKLNPLSDKTHYTSEGSLGYNPGVTPGFLGLRK